VTLKGRPFFVETPGLVAAVERSEAASGGAAVANLQNAVYLKERIA